MSSVVTQDPEILGGEPVFTGTRVPVRSLFDHLEAGDSIEQFLEGFPSVKRQQVIALLEKRESMHSLRPRCAFSGRESRLAIASRFIGPSGGIRSADRMGRDREWRTITQSSRGWIRCARDVGQQYGAPAEHWAVCNRSRRVMGSFKSIG